MNDVRKGKKQRRTEEDRKRAWQNIECETAENEDLPSSLTINNLRDLQVLRPNYKAEENVLMGYIANGMVPAVWVHVVSHLMSHCFAKSILAPVIRTMIVKLIIAYPYHVLHTVLMYKFNENHSYIVETLLEEAERRVSDRTARSRLHEIVEDMTAAHVAYIQFVAVKISDTRFFKNDSCQKIKVVPLDSKCGIIEFCQGTVSLST
ncbi:hypothetical protein TELCIR_14185 [Teladorsagia circumcincta]|uniref:Uncharacterized protein n=1 Tax=Teladorsagia circumcincta TaxID=45464 RepID=A0A2G9U1X4_TELCI|nr:hypothetical protein TELCIR_14185 [Teladorsagia circumcincta]